MVPLVHKIFTTGHGNVDDFQLTLNGVDDFFTEYRSKTWDLNESPDLQHFTKGNR
jgi:hypothetical protein